MYDILSCIYSVNCPCQACISLWNCFSCFLIHFVKMDVGCGMVVYKGMGKGCTCRCLGQIIEVEGVNILRISDISVRSLSFGNIVTVCNRQIYGKCCISILSCCNGLQSCTLCYNHAAIIIFNVISGIQSVLSSVQRIFRIGILLCHADSSFLSAVVNAGCLILYLYGLILVLNVDCLRCGIDGISVNACSFCYHIGS